jgi:hypothetical protein
MTRALEQPHFVPYGDGRRSSAERFDWWCLDKSLWLVVVSCCRNESQLNGLKVTLFDKELLRTTAGQRTRFLAALGMTSLEMPKATSQRKSALSQRPSAISYQPTTISHQPMTIRYRRMQKAF